jgi:hypothetical protein
VIAFDGRAACVVYASKILAPSGLLVELCAVLVSQFVVVVVVVLLLLLLWPLLPLTQPLMFVQCTLARALLIDADEKPVEIERAAPTTTAAALAQPAGALQGPKAKRSWETRRHRVGNAWQHKLSRHILDSRPGGSPQARAAASICALRVQAGAQRLTSPANPERWRATTVSEDWPAESEL